MNCKQCTTGFTITPADEKIYKKMNVPSPTLCPDCRQQRRIAWRNDRHYYKNTCHLCKKKLISIYAPDKDIIVACPDCFWNDQFDPLKHGQEFDFDRPFFEQFAEMRAKVPRIAIFNTQSENSEFTIHSAKNRNCYMASSLVDCEDVHYSDWVMNSRDCIDLLMCTHMEMCYECNDSHNCAHSNYLELCFNASDSFLAFDCRGCKRAVGCVSMRNRKNHILNQPASKEECIAIIQKLKTDPKFFTEFKKKYEELKISLPKCDAWMLNAENCSGNYVTNSKNAKFAFNVEDIEDARYVYDIKSVKDGYDVTRTIGEYLYETQGNVELKFGKFCNLTYHSDNMAYCDNCQNCSFCFGCISLKGHQYCIFNKQYKADEYRKLVPKIIDHMKKTKEYGEFFPIELSPFGYNETKAQEFYPLTKEEVLKHNWQWSDYEQPISSNVKTIPADRLPDNIKDIPDDILNWAIICEATGKPFKITSQELKFYRKKGLPIPRHSPTQRHYNRVSLQNPRKLYERKCDECQKKIQTTYSPDRPEKVYCESCYLKKIY